MSLKRRINVVDPQWIFDCQTQGQILDAEPYMIKCFSGLVITVTQLTPEARVAIKRMVESNGGRFSADLVRGLSTHLVALERDGPKYDMSVEWGIHVCSADWIEQCVEKGYRLAESTFGLPCNDDTMSMTVPSARAQEQAQERVVSESHKRSREVTREATRNEPRITREEQARRREAERRQEEKERREEQREELRLKAREAARARRSESSLPRGPDPTTQLFSKLRPTREMAPCGVLRDDIFFIAGFERSHADYCIRLVLKGGGIRHQVLTEDVTKVLLGPYTPPLLRDTVRKRAEQGWLYVVKVTWVSDLVAQGDVDETQPS
jgi:hypothetical protein